MFGAGAFVMAKKKPATKAAPAAAPAEKAPAKSVPKEGKTMGEKKKGARKQPRKEDSMMVLAAPAVAALFGPAVLTRIQKPEKGKAGDDKTALLLAGGAWWLSKQQKYKVYAPAAMVLAVMGYRRQQVLAGEMSSDPEKYIVAEATVSK